MENNGIDENHEKLFEKQWKKMKKIENDGKTWKMTRNDKNDEKYEQMMRHDENEESNEE